MRQLLIFITLTVIGYITGIFTNINPIEVQLGGIEIFAPFAGLALVIGLYSSVVGIDLNAIANRKLTAVIVVTIAVPLQILATGAVMYLIYPVGVSFLLAVAMTQIDPLSVDTLLEDKESMSPEAKGLLRIWASFDDPVTVLFGFLILLPLITGTSPSTTGFDTLGVILYVALNTLPALAVWLLQKYTPLFSYRLVGLLVLIGLLTLAFFTQSYLLAAILGLILRPLPDNYLHNTTTLLYYTIVFVVGMAIYSHNQDLADGIRIGAILAIVEFFVIQPLTALIVFNGTVNDVFRIAYAQQNGLTTLLMGIAFQTLGVDVLYILLPGIVIVNILNLTVNKIYSWKEARGYIHPS